MSDEIYPGNVLFIYANIFLYGILGHFKFGNACKVFLEQVNKGEYKASWYAMRLFILNIGTFGHYEPKLIP